MSAERLAWIRRLWFLALAFAIVLDVAGTAFVLRDVYRHDPIFGRLSLVSEPENDGSVTFRSFTAEAGAGEIPRGSRVVAVRGQPVARDAPVWALAAALSAEEGETVPVRFALPGGERTERRITATDRYYIEAMRAEPVSREVRMLSRMAISLTTCLALIACAVLLFVRRPQDPVALLFSFSFLIFAAIIDPPLLLWMAAGMGHVFDVYVSLGWLLLVIGIAVFPDGRFNPRPMRWVLVVAPVAAFALSFDELPTMIGVAIAFVAPLLLLVSHAIKYRRFPPGIERQQVKWAAFGFASGLLLLSAAIALTEVPGAERLEQIPLYGLLVLTLFSFGFLAMALGLLVALLRFRLWEADRVISRSAISAGVTLLVGVIWTLSVDFVKMGVEWTLGEENATVATLAGAVLAAGIFAPTQALAMRWAKTRLQGDESRIKRLISRLAVWRTTESPEEIAVRTLSALNAAVHCGSAALLVDGPRGPRLLAARDLDDADRLSDPDYDPVRDPRFVLSQPLEDEDGPMGLLLVGPRSDLNRYNAGQLHSVETLAEPLAESLRTALKRSHHAESVQTKLGSVEERLARLEQQGPRLSPT